MGTFDTTDEYGAIGEGTLVSIGYEGKSVGDIVAQLLQQDVRVLVDVRLTPLSRKPGLSKTKLSQALAAPDEPGPCSWTIRRIGSVTRG
jgi:hypothetical protein